MKDAARNSVLGAIRQHLAEARRRESFAIPTVDRTRRGGEAIDRETMVDEFARRLGAVGGVAWRVPDAAAAAACVDAICTESNATRVALGDAPLVARVRALMGSEVAFLSGDDRNEIATCDVGVTSARAAIAETGSLLLDSGHERYRLVSLLPEVHVALVPVEVLTADLDTAFALLGERPANAITIVTGPSRTADIELTLVVGVHGPKALHVVLIDG